MTSNAAPPRRATPEDPETEPVINNPYQFPDWHWQLNEYAIALKGTATPGRRSAQTTPAVPSAKIKTDSLGQAGMIGAVFAPLTLVNEIRAAVQRWQDVDRFAGATAVTRRLLEYWIDPASADQAEQSELRPYFAQRDAVLTHIYLREIRPPQLLDKLAAINDKYNNGIDRLGHKMATGAGKTLAMAMIILWQAANHRSHPEDPRFTNRFLMLTPGITVKERLEASLNPQDPRSDFHTFPIAPPGSEWADALSHIRVHTANWQQFEPHTEPGAPSGWARRLLQGGEQPMTPEEQAHRRENPEDIIHRLAAKGHGDADRILVFNDESHHCHRGDPDQENPADTKWFLGLQLIRDAGRLLYAADFSATPTYIAQDNPRPVDWLVSDYSLLDAMEAGLVKIPQLPTALGNNPAKSEYRDLYAHSKREERNNFDPDNASRNQLLKQALQDLYADYARLDAAWQAQHAKRNTGHPAPLPVIAVIMNRVDTANRIFEYIAENKIADRLPLLSNARDETTPPNTIIVHSQLEADEKEARVPQAMAQAVQRLADRYRQHYPFPEKETPAAILRQVMNTVGQPGKPGEKVRCVISVDMLTEGWDTKTVTHLLGFRRFGTSLLCEQAAGRTLRRVRHELNPDGRYPPEYAVVIGIPYPQYATAGGNAPCPQCRKEPEQCSCPPPPGRVNIEPLPEKVGFLVEWPHLARLERADKIHSLRLEPADSPEEPCPVRPLPRNRETLLPSIGPQTVLSNSQTAVSRQRFLYAIAEQAVIQLKEKFQSELESDSGELTLLTRTLFADALAAAKVHHQHGRIPNPPDDSPGFPADLENLTQAAQWLLRSVDYLRPTPPGGRPNMTARPARNPWLSTELLKAYETAETPESVYGPARKAHINYAHCDSAWEVAVARQLDEMPAIKRWVRNRRLNWYIPYVTDGQPRRYYPDFIAVAALPDGKELNIVIEVKGQEDAEDRRKKQWTEDYWLPAVNRHPEFGPQVGKVWDYLYLNDAALAAKAAEPLNALIARHQAEHPPRPAAATAQE